MLVKLGPALENYLSEDTHMCEFSVNNRPSYTQQSHMSYSLNSLKGLYSGVY